MFRCLVLFLSVFAYTLTAQAETVFKVAYEDKVQFPYYMGETTEVLADKPGSAVELIKLIESKVPGVKVELVRYPWKRCLSELENGNVDGAFNASFKEKRLKFGAYPWKSDSVDTDRRLTTIAYHFYKQKGSDFAWDGKTVSGNASSIGAPAGYSIVGDLKKLGLKVSEASSTQNNMRKLIAGRVSAIALQDVTGDYFIKKEAEFSSLEKVEPPIKTKPYYLMISNQFKRKNPEIAEQIWDGVASLREESLNEITEKYFQ